MALTEYRLARKRTLHPTDVASVGKRIDTFAADECDLWLGAFDPAAGQHYLKGY